MKWPIRNNNLHYIFKINELQRGECSEHEENLYQIINKIVWLTGRQIYF